MCPRSQLEQREDFTRRQDLLWSFLQTLIHFGSFFTHWREWPLTKEKLTHIHELINRISQKSVLAEGDETSLRKASPCLSALASYSQWTIMISHFNIMTWQLESTFCVWLHLALVIILKGKQSRCYLFPFSRCRQPQTGTVTCSRSGCTSAIAGMWSQGD